MPLILDHMRAEFARFLAEDPSGRWRMDKALAHVITAAYERGLDDGRRQACEDACQHRSDDTPAHRLLREICSPEGYGHAVSDEVRRAAARVVGALNC